MALDVKVKIDLNKASGNLSFGYPCILSVGKAAAYTECSNLDAVKTAGFDTTTDTYKAAEMMFLQKNPPAKIAVCGVAAATDLSALNNKDWRQLVVVGTVTDYVPFIEYVETYEYKQLFVTPKSVDDIPALTKGETTYVGDKVVAFVHTNSLAGAALAGEAAGRTPGSFTYKNLMLNGILPMTFTDAELDAIHEANALTYVTKAGDNVTSEGKAMSGEFIDIIDCMDYIISQIEYKSQKVLNNAPKVSFDNKGIAMLESAAIDVLRTAYNNGIIATKDDGTPDYETKYAPRSEVSASDRTERKYTGGTFRFGLAGAIHYVDVIGTVEV